jgi:hypothetical protein
MYLLTCSGAERSTLPEGDLTLPELQTYDAVLSRKTNKDGEDLCAKYSWVHSHVYPPVSGREKDGSSAEADDSSAETVTQAKVAA